MQRTLSLRPLLAVLLAVLLLAACGDSTKVGDESLLNFEEQAQARLGETTTTVAPEAAPTTVAPAGKAGIGQQTTTTAMATTTTLPPERRFEITINADNSSTTQFDPSASRVFRGTFVTWVNRDTVPRSVEGDKGEFASGPIPPGGTFTYKATTAGRIAYHDGTRPYAVGFLEVV